MSYPVPKHSATTEYQIKKSRFIAYAFYASNRDEAMTQLQNLRVEYPDARHHCWAYVIGDPKSPRTAAMSDDGEPSGTAGKPILNVLQHKKIGDIMLVVVRYFGGIKLGAGGLVRAYSTAADQVISALELVVNQSLVEVQVVGDYALEQSLRHWLSQHEGKMVDVSYDESVTYTVGVIEEERNALSEFVVALGGRLSPIRHPTT